MSKSSPLMALPVDPGESPKVDAFNMLFYSPLRRLLTTGELNKGRARETLMVTTGWLLAVLGDMPPKVARYYMKQFEQIAADSIGYDLDEE